MNRIDEIICFQKLTGDEVQEIARLMLQQSGQRLAAQGVRLEADDGAVELIAREGQDPTLGGAPPAAVYPRPPGGPGGGAAAVR